MEDEELFLAPVRNDEALNLSLDGWEGPLDLLLNLARQQKVDLHQISILALVEQYLAYIEGARTLRLEIAADYLVMAAWLAYLKSCLLLPKDPTVDPSPEELALRLQLRLQRLDAMRDAGARLMGRDRLGRDVFARGAPEGLKLVRKSAWQATAFDLYAAYGRVKARTAPAMHGSAAPDSRAPLAATRSASALRANRPSIAWNAAVPCWSARSTSARLVSRTFCWVTQASTKPSGNSAAVRSSSKIAPVGQRWKRDRRSIKRRSR